jgi:hypothetical protein
LSGHDNTREIGTDESRPDLRRGARPIRRLHGCGTRHNHGSLHPSCYFRRPARLQRRIGRDSMQIRNDGVSTARATP